MTRISASTEPSSNVRSTVLSGQQYSADNGKGWSSEGPQQGYEAVLPFIVTSLEQDLQDITAFYSVRTSAQRRQHLRKRLDQTLDGISALPFSELSQEDKVDYLLVRSYAERQLQEFDFEETRLQKAWPLLDGYATQIEHFCLDRQQVADCDWRATAGQLARAARDAQTLSRSINEHNIEWKGTSSEADWANRVIDELRERLEEAFNFYKGYEPIATWWLSKPHEELQLQLQQLHKAVRERLVGVGSDDKDAIIGDPVGRDGILADLKAEFIAYSPEELIEIGESEYRWCEKEMIRASTELGYGKDWRKALEHVKTMFVEPGKQPLLVQKLAKEAVDYVRKHDLVTVPKICEEMRRTLMMTPQRQKANPFFLGGTNIIVSYPTETMDQEAKMMSMRGNSIPFSKATVFHELVPGHHLQYHMIKRHRTYRRRLFDTPFWMEGWALYWEFLLWERGDFFQTPEERIGTLFWRMHRCARIIFSIKFHLGKMTPQECVDYLVVKVGHERATAEGEVRRSFNGDYRPLYQAGYMLGALQLRHLRHGLVDCGKMKEKDFHDRILKENEMPIDMVKALLTNKHLTKEYEPTWKFYHKEWHSWKETTCSQGGPSY